MKDIISYSKGTEPLEKREDFIFNLVDKLDKESYEMYSEIIDLSDDSFYKINNLLTRLTELDRIYGETVEAYEYLSKIEQSSYDYANKRFQIKFMLTMVTTIYAFIANAFLGIASFILLNNKASKDFINELKKINESIDRFDEKKMNLINTTLNNCTRLFKAKVERMNERIESLKDSDSSIIFSNYYISQYIDGNIKKEYFQLIPEFLKNKIITILKNDLHVDSDDICELLELAKEKCNDGLKLVKRYEKN